MEAGAVLQRGVELMEILKKAKERDDLAKNFECKCGALLRATPGDVKSSTDGEGHSNYYSVSCPECKQEIYVKRWWL